MWALQKFQTYLAGAQLINRTDHKTLNFLKTCQFGNARLTRWMLAIQDYCISVEHCPGKENLVADTLSRVQPERDWKKEKGPSVVTLHSPSNKETDDEKEKQPRKPKEQKKRKIQNKLNASNTNNEEKHQEEIHSKSKTDSTEPEDPGGGKQA